MGKLCSKDHSTAVLSKQDLTHYSPIVVDLGMCICCVSLLKITKHVKITKLDPFGSVISLQEMIQIRCSVQNGYIFYYLSEWLDPTDGISISLCTWYSSSHTLGHVFRHPLHSEGKFVLDKSTNRLDMFIVVYSLAF